MKKTENLEREMGDMKEDGVAATDGVWPNGNPGLDWLQQSNSHCSGERKVSGRKDEGMRVRGGEWAKRAVDEAEQRKMYN